MLRLNVPGAWLHALARVLSFSCASFVLLGACDKAPSPATRDDVELDGGTDDANDGNAPQPLDDAGSSESGAIDASVAPDDAGKNLPTESGTDPMAPRILRGAAQQTYWDLVIRGVDLSEYEGRQVTVLIGFSERPPERIGLAATKIVGGTFELSFPQVWETSLYKLKRAFIDLNEDGRCTVGSDLAFEDARATMIDALELRAAPSGKPADFPRARDAAEVCAALNAPFPSQ